MAVREAGDPLRVFVCDDSFGYPTLVRTWCEEFTGVEPVGVATTVAELRTMLPASHADVVLLDLMLPDGIASPELVEEIRGLMPGIRVVLTSAMTDEILLGEARRIGADAHLTKLAPPAELLAAIVGPD